MIFFVSCGLETLYYLDYPENGHDVSHSNADRLLDYFRFRTADSSNIDAGFDFRVLRFIIRYSTVNQRLSIPLLP